MPISPKYVCAHCSDSFGVFAKVVRCPICEYPICTMCEDPCPPLIEAVPTAVDAEDERTDPIVPLTADMIIEYTE